MQTRGPVRQLGNADSAVQPQTRSDARQKSQPGDAIRAHGEEEQDPRVVDCSDCDVQSAVAAPVEGYDSVCASSRT